MGYPRRLHHLGIWFPDHLQEGSPVRLEQFVNNLLIDVRDDHLPNFRVHVREDSNTLHLLCLGLVILGRSDVVHRASFIAVDQKQLDERHHSLLPQWRGRVLVTNREEVPTATILDRGEDDVSELLTTGLIEQAQFQQFRSGRVGTQLDPNLRRMLPVFPPLCEPLLQQFGRNLCLN